MTPKGSGNVTELTTTSASVQAISTLTRPAVETNWLYNFFKNW